MKEITMRSVSYRLSAVFVSLLLAGCSVGPDFHAPENQLPANWHNLSSTQQSRPETADTSVSWWKNFNDPQLDSLIRRAIAGNLTLQQTVLRIAGAREQVNEATGGFFPTLSAQASYARQQEGLKGLLKSHGVYDSLNEESSQLVNSATGSVNFYQGGFDTRWELDLWGKVRRQREMAQAEQLSAIEQRNDALVSLEAEVARTYLQLRAAQAMTQVTEEQVTIARQTQQLTESQMQNGLAPATDLQSATAQVTSLEAQLPQYQAQISQAMNGLAVLLGKAPGTLDNELQQVKPLPALPAMISVGVPAELARRRPDIQEAEATLHARTAEIGVSVAQLFPDISLTGQLGVRNTDASYLDDWSSHFYSIGPGISLPIFQGGQLVSQVRLARASQASAALDYRNTVLKALQEVENGLVSYRADQQQLTSLQASADALQQAFSLAKESYSKGLSSYINALDAQRQLAQTQLQLISVRAQTATDLVALYKALGGGWENYQAVSLPDYPVFGATPNTGVAAQ